MRKQHAAAQGIVAGDRLDTVYQREIFFPVDPATLDYIDYQEHLEGQISTLYLEFDPTPLLKYLPELEAEIFWLHYEKKKHQKDIAKLLDLSQPTVSYRYRRTITKLRYLMTIRDVPLKEMLTELDFLRPNEQEILYDLFYYLNQELVGAKHDVRQSTVKWVFNKTKRTLERFEPEEPERWQKHLGMLYLLENCFAIRIMH
jgi:hypothetical protein